jgi:hypothetical protein
MAQIPSVEGSRAFTDTFRSSDIAWLCARQNLALLCGRPTNIAPRNRQYWTVRPLRRAGKYISRSSIGEIAIAGVSLLWLTIFTPDVRHADRISRRLPKLLGKSVKQVRIYFLCPPTFPGARRCTVSATVPPIPLGPLLWRRSQQSIASTTRDKPHRFFRTRSSGA